MCGRLLIVAPATGRHGAWVFRFLMSHGAYHRCKECVGVNMFDQISRYPKAPLLVVTATSWASREVVLMFAGRFSNKIFDLDPETWYGYSLGQKKKLP